ncbi:hypothetical protein F5888DRAFT_1803614 [Russula emetica]|nr:hypothetical protein F5888DRAFT_1803614 [Russula emetica]
MEVRVRGNFVLTPTVIRSRPTVLIALATSLLCIWNVAPLDITSSLHRGIQSAPLADPPPKSQAHVAMLAGVRAAFGISQYFAALLLVFAPRYMLGAVELICADVAVLVGMWLGVGRIISRITRVFAFPAAPRASSSNRSKARQQSEESPKLA